MVTVLKLFFHLLQNEDGDVCLFKVITFFTCSPFICILLKVSLES